MKKFVSLFLFFLTFSSQVFAQNSADAKKTQAESVKKIENYLNNIKTLEADFIQTASNGSSAEGKLYIKKPNKLNMEYAGDANIAIIGDGRYVIYIDKDLDQVTHINYSDIPATLILGNDIKIDGKQIAVQNFYQDSGITTVTFKYVNNPNINPITLTFNNKPFELKQWKVVDPQGIEVTVSLYNAKEDINLDNKLFRYKNKSLNPLAN